jgi:hypothetical protein
MDEFESLSHSKWECKYPVVFIPKCRRRTIYQQLRPHLGEVFRRLAERKESPIEEGHLMADHVHMLISIPIHERCCNDGRCGSSIEATLPRRSLRSWSALAWTRVRERVTLFMQRSPTCTVTTKMPSA